MTRFFSSCSSSSSSSSSEPKTGCSAVNCPKQETLTGKSEEVEDSCEQDCLSEEEL